MTVEELDAIYQDAAWLIAKRSGVTAFKALTIGSESLEKTVEKIADMYDLTDSERRILRPTITEDAQTATSAAANMFKTATGMAFSAAESAKIVKAANAALKNGRIAKSLLTIVTRGPKAAMAVAQTGKVVGKINPVVAVATATYVIGTTGWFAVSAERYNRAAYDIALAKLTPTSKPDPAVV